MLSYKRENGRNEKLMGWAKKSKASWSGTNTSQIFHSNFINSGANSTKCLHSKEKFQYFPTPTMDERKKDIGASEFMNLL